MTVTTLISIQHFCVVAIPLKRSLSQYTIHLAMICWPVWIILGLAPSISDNLRFNEFTLSNDSCLFIDLSMLSMWRYLFITNFLFLNVVMFVTIQICCCATYYSIIKSDKKMKQNRASMSKQVRNKTNINKYKLNK